MLLGVAGAGALCYLGATEASLLDDKHLCLVLNENFNGDSLDESVWSRDVQLGGFGYVCPPSVFSSLSSSPPHPARVF